MGEPRGPSRRHGSEAVELIAHLRVSLWLAALGTVVLYVFFIAVASISPGQIAGLSAGIALLAAVIALRQLRLHTELASPAGDPALRRACNRQRERRGF